MLHIVCIRQYIPPENKKKETRCKCNYLCILIYGLNSPLLHNNILTNNTLYLAGLPFLAANYSDCCFFLQSDCIYNVNFYIPLMVKHDDLISVISKKIISFKISKSRDQVFTNHSKS